MTKEHTHFIGEPTSKPETPRPNPINNNKSYPTVRDLLRFLFYQDGEGFIKYNFYPQVGLRNVLRNKPELLEVFNRIYYSLAQKVTTE